MNRWFWKRWVWAVVVGTTAAVGLTVAQQGTDAPSGPPKVGDVITLKFRDLPDRQVKVLKSDKQPDGSIMSEVKDTKTGETFTLMDKPDSFAAPAKAGAKTPAVTPPPSPTAPKATEPTKAPVARPPIGPMKLPDGLPKAKPRTSDPLLPSLKESLPDLPTAREQEKERRFLPSFGKSSDAAKPAEPEGEKPGFLKRVFGKKPAEPTPSLPPATVINTKPPFPTPPASPPATSSARPPAAVPTPGVMKTHPTVTLEPPRTQPVQPVVPPVPLTPNPVSVPTAPPASAPLPIPAIPAAPPAPGPAALPAIPSVPSVPSIPVPPPGGLPSIPLPPNGTSMKEPATPPVPKAEVSVAPKPLPAKVAAAPVKESERAVVTAQAPATPTPATVVTASKSVPAPAQAALPPVVAVPVTDPGRTAMMRDIEPHVAALEKGLAPSQRAMAARALGGCRHGSSDTVKMTIFRAAQNDPNPMVRAVCIEELCKLGYFEPAFELHLTKACEDANDEVRSAAKAAMKQMYPRR